MPRLEKAAIEQLKRQGNICKDWSKISVADKTVIDYLHGNQFVGNVRIEKIDIPFLEYEQLSYPTGVRNSALENCSIGENCSIQNISYLAGYTTDEQVLLNNCGQIAYKGGMESFAIQTCNENGSRSIYPFKNMPPSLAHLLAKSVDKTEFRTYWKEYASQFFHETTPIIQANSVILNSDQVINCFIGAATQIKNCTELRSLYLDSQKNNSICIQNNVIAVQGILEPGSCIKNAVIAENFYLGEKSELSNGLRLTQTYVSANSHLACCEVTHCLLLPFHEQHHNNSFLIASCVEGQSNIAAAAVIGSNHNSRAADGELLAKRGFWPGLASSFKFNSSFSSFTIIAKGDYHYEIQNPFPFSLISQNPHTGQLNIYPAYYFSSNAYALFRNDWKYKQRDVRLRKASIIETDILNFDTIDECSKALQLLESMITNENIGLNSIDVNGFEYSPNTSKILKPAKGIQSYKSMIILFLAENYEYLNTHLPAINIAWMNLGGQIIDSNEENKLFTEKNVECFYKLSSQTDDSSKSSFLNYLLFHVIRSTKKGILEEACKIQEKLLEKIIQSREKDFSMPKRAITFSSDSECQHVYGNISDDQFIQDYTEKSLNNIQKWKAQIQLTISE